MRPSLFIATPTADGIMLCDYVASVVRLAARLREGGIATTYRSVDGADLILQRNILADAFLRSDCTHLLFIDSDMAFGPDLAERLLGFDRPLIGAIYPKRTIDLAKLRSLAAGRPLDQALALAYDWNVRILGGRVTIENGICQVDGLGGGFLLIRRDCFETLADRTDIPSVRADEEGRQVRAFFREMPNGDAMLDLDYAFCRRWTDCGGKVWAYPDADIRHVGDYRGGMPFAAVVTAYDRADGAPMPPISAGIEYRHP